LPFRSSFGILPSVNSSIRSHFLSVCRRLDTLRFVVATDGNVSIRLPRERMLITPSGVNKGKLKAADLVTLRLDGMLVAGRRKASTEADMHRFVYESRPDVNAVVHAHPTCATAFAAARIPLNLAVFPEVIVGLGPVPLAEYATPSTAEVRESLRPHIGSANAILLANHGAITFGATLDEAMNRMEKLEHFAHMIILARQLGGERLLTQQEYERLKAISISSYGKEIADSTKWKTA